MGRNTHGQARSGVELALIRKASLKQILLKEAPKPLYPLVISHKIPRAQLLERALRALKRCPQVTPDQLASFEHAVSGKDPDDDRVILHILRYMEID